MCVAKNQVHLERHNSKFAHLTPAKDIHGPH